MILNGDLSFALQDQNAQAYPAPAAPLPEGRNLKVDFGLFQECFTEVLSIPDFDSSVQSTVCLRKHDVCNVVDNDKMASAAEKQDSSDIQQGISTICHKLTAVTVFCFFVLVFTALFALCTYVPAVNRIFSRLLTPWIQVAILATLAIFALIAISLWASAGVDGTHLENHIALLFNVYLASDMLFFENAKVEMGYSAGYMITVLILLAIAATATVAGIFGAAVCLRPCCDGAVETQPSKGYAPVRAESEDAKPLNADEDDAALLPL